MTYGTVINNVYGSAAFDNTRPNLVCTHSGTIGSLSSGYNDVNITTITGAIVPVFKPITDGFVTIWGLNSPAANEYDQMWVVADSNAAGASLDWFIFSEKEFTPPVSNDHGLYFYDDNDKLIFSSDEKNYLRMRNIYLPYLPQSQNVSSTTENEVFNNSNYFIICPSSIIFADGDGSKARYYAYGIRKGSGTNKIDIGWVKIIEKSSAWTFQETHGTFGVYFGEIQRI